MRDERILNLDNGYSIRSYVSEDHKLYIAEIILESPISIDMYNEFQDIILYRKVFSNRDEAIKNLKNRVDLFCKATEGYAHIVIMED